MPVPVRNIETAIERIRSRLGDRISIKASIREHHGRDLSWHEPRAPHAVAFPESNEEVIDTVRICADLHVPVIPFGSGTSVEAQVTALHGGICIDLSRMNQVLRISAEDQDATVQAGVTRKQLNSYLRDTGLFFPIDPGADASIGGMTATRASGTNAVRYGTMKDNVLNLTVVLPDGRLIRTARRARKSSAGYDLTRLFIGSEGTLGVITEITVRLHGVPEAISSAVCSFATIEGAIDTVISTIQSCIPVARVELLDEIQVDAINRYSGTDYAVAPTLLFEFHGTTAGVSEQSAMVQALAVENGGSDFRWATRADERAALWQARHDAAFAALALSPGASAFVTDVCVPISRLAECIVATKQDLASTTLKAPLVGHVGDGNFHLVILVDRTNPKELAEAQRLNERLVMRALALDGTCTGEHGIGSGKVQFLEAEHGEAVQVMRQVKAAIDPHNIMNPGKIIPDQAH
jgi:D-lactate dehydrogenase (cytochrome)